MYNFINGINTVDRFRRGFFGKLGRTGEPTFLTFSIDFKIDYLNLFEGSLGLHPSPLFHRDSGSTNSAFQYLINKGFLPEAARLKKFTDVLKYLNENEPWYFQSITGLDKLWAASTNMEENFKGKGLEVNIETLESIDLRITYLADLYRKSIYDSVYMRELVPMNLRYFLMDIYVAEFRDLRTLTETAVFNNIVKNKTVERMATKGLNLIKGASDYFINNASFLKYECRFCEFDFSESSPVKDVNVYDPVMTKNMFKVKIGNLLEKHSYSYFDIMTQDSLTTKHNDEKYIADRPFKLDDMVGLGLTLLQAGRVLKDAMDDISNSKFMKDITRGKISGGALSSTTGASISSRRR